LVECFADHHLIPPAALENGKHAHPPTDSSAWLRAGKVLDNQDFGAWFSENSAVVVNGRSLGDSTTAIEARRAAWPASLCGPAAG
jgi:hypothetical protein